MFPILLAMLALAVVLIVGSVVLSGIAQTAELRFPMSASWEYVVLTGQEHTFGPYNIPKGFIGSGTSTTFTFTVTDVGISAGETIGDLVSVVNGYNNGKLQYHIEKSCWAIASLTSYHRLAGLIGGIYNLEAQAYDEDTPTTATEEVDFFNVAGPFAPGSWVFKMKMDNVLSVWGAASAFSFACDHTMFVRPQLPGETPVTVNTFYHPTATSEKFVGKTLGVQATLSSIGSYTVDGNVLSTVELTEVKRDNQSAQGLARNTTAETTYIVFNWALPHQLEIRNSTAQALSVCAIDVGRSELPQALMEMSEVPVGSRII